MVCVECIVVPVVVLILSFASRFLAQLYAIIFPSSVSPPPPAFNPASINLAAHGLAHAFSTPKLEDDSKEGPALRKPAVHS